MRLAVINAYMHKTVQWSLHARLQNKHAWFLLAYCYCCILCILHKFIIEKKHIYRTSAPRVGAHTIPGDDIKTGRIEPGTVARTDESTSADALRVGDWILVVNASCRSCVHISPVGSDHWSPSKWEGSWSVTTSGSSSQGDVAIVVDLRSTRKYKGIIRYSSTRSRTVLHAQNRQYSLYWPGCKIGICRRSGTIDAFFVVCCCRHP